MNRTDFWLTECKKHLWLAANDWDEAARCGDPETDSATVRETFDLLIKWVENGIRMHHLRSKLDKGEVACD